MAPRSVSDYAAVEIIGVGAVDLDGRNLADFERPPAFEKYRAVDLRCIAAASPFGESAGFPAFGRFAHR